ncbi:MAG TPA: c-type cytochrome [Blastocatellia bacterium]|nr:c-type cytochrome [Blastocatellia bacterium]
MLRRLFTIAALAVGLLVLAQSVPSSSQAIAGQGRNERGRKLYQQYCASCHGTEGKGDGSVALTLKTEVPDLTTIEKREGKFDGTRVKQYISGEIGVTAHGEKDMPVWGYVFRSRQGQSVSALNVHALMEYLRSIQEK